MSENCDPIKLENIEFCATDEIISGISDLEVYGAAISDFKVIAAPPKLDVATNFEEAGAIAETHTFKESRGFHKIQIQADSGSVENTQLGEKSNLGVQNSLTGAMRNNKKTKGYLRYYKNTPMIFIVREKTGNLVQIGSQNCPAYIVEFTGNTGAAPGDAKNIQVIIRDAQPYFAPDYEGTITQFPAPAPEPDV
ncbi:hypothetical protein [Zunongwangia endophytica]|uniref:Phage tail protein n=1 Tax=Zunongwangia endophytica TaxID=1808945 RepID=A0ABV8HAA5_9FLAO|nr:hypothetical protein [Zunongwangia endophytica]MDN3595312.1 hypothetical protein [Zunongwangia endophytica]